MRPVGHGREIPAVQLLHPVSPFAGQPAQYRYDTVCGGPCKTRRGQSDLPGHTVDRHVTGLGVSGRDEGDVGAEADHDANGVLDELDSHRLVAGLAAWAAVVGAEAQVPAVGVVDPRQAGPLAEPT